MDTNRDVSVECYSGHTYAQEPRAFVYHEQRHVVTAVRKRWREPGGPCFEIVADDGVCYKLVYDEVAEHWQISTSKVSGLVEQQEQHRKEEIKDDHRSAERD